MKPTNWRKTDKGIWVDRYHPDVVKRRGEGINKRKRPTK